AEEVVVNGHVSQLPRERLVSVLHREVCADLKKVIAEEVVVNGHVSQLPRERLMSVLHREVCADLKKVRNGVKDCSEMQLHYEAQKETELKIAQKCSSIMRLRRKRS
nr:hypothetical protein [Tanacetum cinerariifolium]